VWSGCLTCLKKFCKTFFLVYFHQDKKKSNWPTKEKKRATKTKGFPRKLLLFGSISQPVISTLCSLYFLISKNWLVLFFFQIFLFWQKFLHFWPGSWRIVNNFPWKQTWHFHCYGAWSFGEFRNFVETNIG